MGGVGRVGWVGGVGVGRVSRAGKVGGQAGIPSAPFPSWFHPGLQSEPLPSQINGRSLFHGTPQPRECYQHIVSQDAEQRYCTALEVIPSTRP